MKLPSSRKILVALVAAGLLALPGCMVRDVMWGMFGSAYSDGGGSPAERQSHYNHTLDRAGGRWDGGVGHYDPVLDR